MKPMANRGGDEQEPDPKSSEQDLEEFITTLSKRWEPSASVAGGPDGAIGDVQYRTAARWFRPIYIQLSITGNTCTQFPAPIPGRRRSH